MEIAILLTMLIIAVAYFGDSFFGFGGGLIAIPLLSLVLGVKDAVTLALIFQLLMGILVWKTYKHIDWKSAKPMTYTVLLGTIAGTFLLSSSSVVFLQIFLAAVIGLFLIKSVFFGAITIGKSRNNLSASAAGLGGGLLQGLIGTGGPILTMYTSVAIKKKVSIRATLIYLFFITSIVRMTISIPQQLFSSEILQLALYSLPFFAIAIYCGQKIHHVISERHYKLSINIILAFSAAALVLKAL